MRVVHVTQALYPMLMGGSALQCHEMANAQAAAGDDVTVHTVRYRREPEGHPVPTDYRIVLHRRIPFLWDLMGTAGNPCVPGVSRAIAKSDADVVHLHSHLFFASWFGLRGARRAGIPTVLTVHGVRAVRGLLTNAAQEAWLRSMSRAMFRSTDLVLCLTQRDADEVIRYGAPKERVRVVFNAYDPERFPLGQSGRQPGSVVWVGRFVEEKGLRYLLEAWSEVLERVPDAQLTLVGDGPLRHELELQARQLGFAGTVHFVGTKEQSEVAALLRSSLVFCLPSIQEGFPKALLEAMASGCAVVTTDGLAEIVAMDGTVVPARSSQGLAHALVKYLLDPSAAVETGRRAHAAVLAKYSWPALLRTTNLIYAEAIERRKRDGRTTRA